MLKTCQLVNILGGTVVYEAIKTIMLGLLFLFSLLIGKDWFILFKFFFFFLLMKRESLGHFYLPFVPLIQAQYFRKVERKTREREKKERQVLEKHDSC